jgi:hypothetical protein
VAIDSVLLDWSIGDFHTFKIKKPGCLTFYSIKSNPAIRFQAHPWLSVIRLLGVWPYLLLILQKHIKEFGLL